MCLVVQLCQTLCDPMNCSPLGSSVHWDSPRQEYWSGLPCPPPGDLLNPGIEPWSPTLQVGFFTVWAIWYCIYHVKKSISLIYVKFLSDTHFSVPLKCNSDLDYLEIGGISRLMVQFLKRLPLLQTPGFLGHLCSYQQVTNLGFLTSFPGSTIC